MKRPPLGPDGGRVLFLLGLLSALQGLALVGVAEAVARGVVAVIAGDPSGWRAALVLGIGAGALRAGATWAVKVVAARAASRAERSLRRELAQRVLAGGVHDVGTTAAVGTVGLDALDDYYARVLPSAVAAAVVPLLVGARILSADWVSALVVVLTVPLVPLFMVLVGQHTREQADRSTAALERLSHHLAELARGLPVLVGLGRLDEQAAALHEVSEAHRRTTMTTLRTAFLSSLVLELISTLSVAVVAVFVGVRLVHGELDLAVGLVALVLAPECFTPLRNLGAAFHASQDGVAALCRSREIASLPVPADVRRPAHTTAGAPGVRINGLVVRHPGRAAPVLAGLDAEIPAGCVLSVEGPSGSGKSTLLGVLAGTVAAQEGTVTGIDPDRVAWVPQHVHTVGDTVLDELALHAADPAAARRILDRVALTALADRDPAQLSPGELRRLGVARGLARVDAGARLLLLDEPTAHLDPAAARRVEELIAGLSGTVTVVLASHETAVTALADRRLLLGAAATRGTAPADPRTRQVQDPAPEGPPPGEQGGHGALHELGAFLGPHAGRATGAAALGTAAALFAAALTMLSGWLIVRASEQPHLMYLLVAIVGVRFFGIGRAVLRYAERLATHDAVLAATTALRGRLWAGLAARGPASRGLATPGTALDHLVAAADRVRDLVPRVLLPPLVGLGTGVGALAAVLVLFPAALPALALALGGGLCAGPAAALLADRSAARSTLQARSEVLRRFTAVVAAAGELRANGRAPAVLAGLDALEGRSHAAARRTARAQGLGEGVVVLACSTASVLVLPATAPAVAGGTIAPAVVAALVLLPLALVDPLLGVVDAVQQWPALAASLRKVRAVTDTPPSATTSSPAARGPVPARIGRLELDDLGVAWPAAPAPAFRGLRAVVRHGEWLVVEGPSGSGKSTLLTTLLGHLPAVEGSWRVDGVDSRDVDPGALRRRIAWCPQEAHLFDSTIRGNLLLARGREDRPTERQMLEVLARVGLGALIEDLPEGLDTPVGPGGDRLSGGQRQRLAVARALLTPADIVLLDEPTAHLDGPAAEAVLADLRAGLADRIVVLVTHHAQQRRPQDVLLRLPAAPRGAAPPAGSGAAEDVHRGAPLLVR